MQYIFLKLTLLPFCGDKLHNTILLSLLSLTPGLCCDQYHTLLEQCFLVGNYDITKCIFVEYGNLGCNVDGQMCLNAITSVVMKWWHWMWSHTGCIFYFRRQFRVWRNNIPVRRRWEKYRQNFKATGWIGIGFLEKLN